MGIKWQSSSSGTTTLSTVSFQTSSSANFLLTSAYFQTSSSVTTKIYPDAATPYTMTFSTSGTDYIGAWSDSSSATIYVGDYLAVSGTSTKTLTCKAGSSSGSTRWSRSISQHASSPVYTYSYPTLYGGTSAAGVALGTGITYDGSYTNIFAYATRSSSSCTAKQICPADVVCPSDHVICTKLCSGVTVCTIDALNIGDSPDSNGEWEEIIE